MAPSGIKPEEDPQDSLSLQDIQPNDSSAVPQTKVEPEAASEAGPGSLPPPSAPLPSSVQACDIPMQSVEVDESNQSNNNATTPLYLTIPLSSRADADSGSAHLQDGHQHLTANDLDFLGRSRYIFYWMQLFLVSRDLLASIQPTASEDLRMLIQYSVLQLHDHLSFTSADGTIKSAVLIATPTPPGGVYPSFKIFRNNVEVAQLNGVKSPRELAHYMGSQLQPLQDMELRRPWEQFSVERPGVGTVGSLQGVRKEFTYLRLLLTAWEELKERRGIRS